MLGQGDWIGITVLRRRSLSFDSTHLGHLARGGRSFPLAQNAGLPPPASRDMGYEFAPPRGAGLGHWPRVPRGSYSHLGLCRPLAPYPRRQGTSLIVGWASQWGLMESKRIADGIPVIHQHE